MAVSSFRHHLLTAIEDQARPLLGADLVLTRRQPSSPASEAFIASLPGEISRETRLVTMAYFPDRKKSRLVQLRALTGKFPFYGAFKTEPASALASYRKGQGALIQESVASQFHLGPGDQLEAGTSRIKILGVIQQVPGEVISSAFFTPRVYIPPEDLDRSGLIQQGSLVWYMVYLKFDSNFNVGAFVKSLFDQLDEHKFTSETINQRKEALGNATENLAKFLNLLGFVILLMGGIGVSSSIYIYVKHKHDTVATLKCLGASTQDILSVFILQAFVLGVLGSVLGIFLGLGIQVALPMVLSPFIPVQTSFVVSPGSILKGMGIGVGASLLFSLLPISELRYVSPLFALRSEFEAGSRGKFNPVKYAVLFILGVVVVLFSIMETGDLRRGLIISGGVFAGLGLLWTTAFLWTRLLKVRFPKSLGFEWRQGMANLFRPRNQTLLLTMVLGLGTFLLLTIGLTQNSILSQFELSDNSRQPNLVLFDVQKEQVPKLKDAMNTMGLPVLQTVPIVAMYLRSVKGVPVKKLKSDPGRSIPDWVLNRVYRSTYRDHLNDNEYVIKGKLRNWDPEEGDIVPVSIEKEIAKELGVGMGDQITFEIQGVPVTTRIASVRKVDWYRVQPTFYFVFPPGLLEEAPQFFVMTTRVSSAEETAQVQNAMSQKFPNISVLDMGLIISTLDRFLEKVTGVMRFMGIFSIITGVIILVGTVVTSQAERLREIILFRTLGASQAQLVRILIVEYSLLGITSFLTALSLSMVSGWWLSSFVFDAKFIPGWGFVLVIFVVLLGLTNIFGYLNCRRLLKVPILEVLRSDL